MRGGDGERRKGRGRKKRGSWEFVLCPRNKKKSRRLWVQQSGVGCGEEYLTVGTEFWGGRIAPHRKSEISLLKWRV